MPVLWGRRAALVALGALGLSACGDWQSFFLPPEGQGEPPPCPRAEGVYTPQQGLAPQGMAPLLVWDGERLQVRREDEGVRRQGGEKLVGALNPKASIRLLGEPNDPLYPQQRPFFLASSYPWNALPWRERLACRPVVAVIDGGFNPRHPELRGRVALATSGFPEDPSPFPPLEGSSPREIHHGNQVAGLVGATTDNGQGVASFSAGKASLLLYRVFSWDGEAEAYVGSVEAIARAMLDAIDRGANIVNLSLGSPVDLGLRPLLQYALAKGVLVVAAAGNDGGELLYPARYPEALAVGAATLGGDLTFYSSRPQAPHPAFFAVPVDEGILSLGYGGNGYDLYVAGAGTSFAAPQVSGALAFYWAKVYGERRSPPAPQEVLRCLRGATEGVSLHWGRFFSGSCP